MCGDEFFFNELTKMEVDFVSFEDDFMVLLKGCGTIQHMHKDGWIEKIRDIYYVLEMKSNILSISQLLNKGNSILIKDYVLYLKIRMILLQLSG